MSAGEHRDRTMDTLLSRTLRGGDPPPPACVDAEMLAAWVDRGLQPAAMTQVEAHVSSCPRCQAMVAALLRAAPSPAAAPSWWRRWRFAWLVPATGAAAALALYVATRPPAPAELESMQSRADAPVRATPGPPAPGPAAPQTSDAAPRREPAPSTSAAAPAVPDNQRARGADAPDSARPSGDAALERQNALSDQALAKTGEARAEAEARERTATFSANEAAPSAAATAAPPAAPPAQAAPAAGSIAAARALTLTPLVEVVSSVGGERWRVTTDGTVSHSTDAGASWQVVDARVTSGIRAGSSPAARVCWLVGANGAVWLTTDGVAFRRVPFPESTALAQVSATGASAASVVTEDGRRFRTSDQGGSWQLSAD